MQGVTVTEFIDNYGFTNMTPEIDTDGRIISVAEVNRPALQLTGFYELFDAKRPQIIGNVEDAYLATLDLETKKLRYEELLSTGIPVLIYSQGNLPDEEVLAYCNHYGVPCVQAETMRIHDLISEVIRWLRVKLAPMISVHGVLMDVYGEGVLIMGESGIGKSEAALELIKRGHRLVSDDVVEIRKVSEVTVIGQAPDITKHFIELRGIGIIDVKALYGVECVKDTQQIDMVIQLEDWNKEKQYDRLGLEERYTEFMGIRVPCHVLPIRPGRNLAIICETAAVNHRQKKMGYNAAEELYKRLQAIIDAGMD